MLGYNCSVALIMIAMVGGTSCVAQLDPFPNSQP